MTGFSSTHQHRRKAERVRRCSACDLTADEWEVTELSREFAFESSLLIDHVFNREVTREHWETAIERARAADDPEATFEQEYAEGDIYREQFAEAPSDQRDKILAVAKEEFRRRADLGQRLYRPNRPIQKPPETACKMRG